MHMIYIVLSLAAYSNNSARVYVGAAGQRPRPSTKTLAILYVIAYITAMRTTSFTDFRRNLSSTIDGVAEDHEPVLITRSGGKPSAVLMSLEDFASYEETRYLLQSPTNAERLLTSVSELDRGKGIKRSLTE